MSQSRGQLRGRVLRYLNKTSAVSGFYAADKVNDAIQMALNHVAVHMFQAGDGWLTDLIFIDTQAGQVSIDLPARVALIREIRYKVGDRYVPMAYNDQDGQASGINSGDNQQAYCYRLLGRKIVFDPQLSDGGEKFLQIEAVYYPQILTDDSDMIDMQFDAAMTDWIMFKVCSILSGSIEKTVRAWAKDEDEAWQAMMTVVTRRLLKSTPIREGWD